VKHQPGLDGLRGLAVAGVVAFHAGFSWATGGFLGVSTFFTLSGFLITSLLVAERASTGRIALGAFWARRARRLLPASLATLLGVAALASWLATPEQLADLRGDVLGALFYVANWRFILDGQSYGELFATPSPVLHFWSLAIEEQLYIFFPLVVVLARRRLVPVLAGLVLLSLALAVGLHDEGGSTSAAYYGTFVRGGELFVGALLAVLVAGRGSSRRAAVARSSRWIGAAALGVLLWSWAVVRQDDVLLYRGGLLVHAALSAAVILAAVQPDGPVRALLVLRPLQALGRISYGVYLIHWPVLVWTDWPLAAQLALTVVLALASFHLLEQPIRRGQWRVRPLVAPAAALAVTVAVVAATLDPPRPATFDLASGSVPAAVAPPADAVAPEPAAPRVAVFGDSTALRTAFALRGWGWTTGRVDMRDGAAEVGCPLARAGAVDFVVARQEPEPQCGEWPSVWAAIARRERLDAAVVQIGPWDVTDRELDGRWTHIGEPEWDALLRAEMHRAVDVLSSGGAIVVWLSSPPIEFGRGQRGLPRGHPISDPARMARLNDVLAEVDAARDELVVLDLAGHLAALGPTEDARLRPDGVHFSEEASAELVAWLGPALLRLISR